MSLGHPTSLVALAIPVAVVMNCAGARIFGHTSTEIWRTPVKSILILALALFAGALSAATLTVTNLNDTGAGSLRDAVTTATSGDDIVFDAALTGTITLTSQIDFGSKVLTLTGNVGTDGKPTITLDGNNATRIISSTATAITLTNLILTNGNASPGGAVRYFGGSSAQATFTNCQFLNNVGGNSGGAFATDGPIVCTDCTLRGNSSTNNGGTVSNIGDATYTRCTFDSNTGSFLGPILLQLQTNDSANFANCTFTNNSGGFATIYAIASGAGTQVTVSSCTFYDNSSGQDIRLRAPSASDDIVCTIDNTIFTNSSGFPSLGIEGSSNGIMHFNSNDYNLFRDGPLISGSTNDQFYVPHSSFTFGPLQDNGGLVDTMVPLTGNPVVDAGNATGNDARGVTRPVDSPFSPNVVNGSDVGAVEATEFRALVVEYNSASIASGVTVQLPDLATPSQAAIETFTLSNDAASTTDLGITLPITISAESNCSVTVTTPPATTLAPSATSDLILSITPTADGPFAFVVTIANDGLNASHTITVYGFAATTSVGGGGGGDGGDSDDDDDESDCAAKATGSPIALWLLLLAVPAVVWYRRRTT